MLARDRILSARELDSVLRKMRETEGAMASADDETREAAMERYGRLESQFTSRGGYAAEAEAASIASSLGLPDRVLGQPLRTLSGGQRRRVELARILFSGAPTLLLDEPTNHLDADSIVWLREFLRTHKGGLVDHQPRRRAARGLRHPGLPPRRRPGRARRLQRGLEEPTCSSARPTSGAATASAPTPRRRPRP